MKLTKSTHYTPEMEETHTVFIENRGVVHVWKSNHLANIRTLHKHNQSEHMKAFFISKKEAEVYVALAKLKGECTESKYWYTINPKK